MAEQVPGTLFILLVAVVGLLIGQYLAVLLLAVGCVAGWQTFHPSASVREIAWWLAMAFWFTGFMFIFAKVI